MIQDKDVCLNVVRPLFPFGALHETVKIKSKCYVKLPVWFSPVGCGNFESLLRVKVLDGVHGECKVLLRGFGLDSICI